MSDKHMASFVTALGVALVTSTASVQASDDGCRVLLCLSNPGGPMQYGACVPPVTRLYRDLARGKPFPTCPEAGFDGGRIGFEPFACGAGYQAYGTDFINGGCTPILNADGEPIVDPVTNPPTIIKRQQPHYVDLDLANGTHQRVWFALER